MSRLLHIVASICARRFMEWRRTRQPMSAVGAGDGMAKIVATFVVMDGCRRRRGRGQRSALARLLLRTHGAGPGALLLEAAASAGGGGQRRCSWKLPRARARGAVRTKTPPFRRIRAFSSCSSKRLYGKHLFGEARCSSFSIKDEELKRFCPARWNGAFLQMRAGVCGTDLAPPSNLLHSASSSRRES